MSCTTCIACYWTFLLLLLLALTAGWVPLVEHHWLSTTGWASLVEHRWLSTTGWAPLVQELYINLSTVNHTSSNSYNTLTVTFTNASSTLEPSDFVNAPHVISYKLFHCTHTQRLDNTCNCCNNIWDLKLLVLHLIIIV